MPRPTTHRFAWVVVVLLVLAVGGFVVWSASPAPSSVGAGRPSEVPARPTVERLVEPPVTTTTAAPPAPAAAPALAVPPVPAAALVAAAEKVTPPGMTLGVAVLDVDTGELVLGRDGARQFMSASLSKLLVAVDVLDQHREEGRSLEPEDLDLVGRSLAGSDDNAMSALWGRHNGAGGVDRVAGKLALTGTTSPKDTDMWGDTQVTAADVVAVYRHVLLGMAAPDRAVIVDALAGTTAVAADGFQQHYGLLHQGASTQRYAKQAWVEYAPAGYLLHSAGVARDSRTGHTYAIALLSIQPYSTDLVARDRLSAIAAAALETVS